MSEIGVFLTYEGQLHRRGDWGDNLKYVKSAC